MPVLGGTAREAVGSACDDVRSAEPADAVDGVEPSLVARPRTEQEVSEVLRAAAAHALTVVPTGRGTKLSWGLPPTSADLRLDLSRLDRVLDHAAGDLVVETEAGARLRDVQQAVAGARQRLALDETVPGASVGGILATNSSGMRRMVAGTSRDLLIGIRVVRVDGVPAKAGGRVVKNVAGYDLGKLMVGSFGTLAVVTRALFRLHPLPEAHRWVSTRAADPAEASRRVQAVLHSQCVPAAVEVEWPHAGAAGGQGVVAVLLEGREAGVRARAETVTRLWEGSASVGEDAPASTYPWAAGAAPADDRDTALKLTFALSGLADVLGAVRDCDAPVTLRGSAGTGVVYGGIAREASVEQVSGVVRRLRDVCERHRGHLVVVDAPPAVKRSLDVWGPVPGVDLMRRVKDQFDPDRRLAPGRFVGGI
jgi:glycolate oxidase FAD binding subunit